MREKAPITDIETIINDAMTDHVSVPEDNYYNPNKLSGKTKFVYTSAALLGTIALGTVGGIIVYTADAWQAPITAKATNLENGSGETVEVITGIEPITVAAAKTNVQGVKEGFEVKAFGIGGNIETVTGGALGVKTELTIDPNDVELSYNPTDKELTISAPDLALGTKVDIPDGSFKVEDSSSSFATLPAEVLSAIAGAIAGTFGGDASQVPLLGEVANGTLDLNSTLRSIIELKIVKAVDEKCTPLITQIPGFTEDLKKNVAKLALYKLVDPEEMDSPAYKELSKLMALPDDERKEIIEGAKVVMSETYTFSPDPETTEQLAKYEESGFLKTESEGKPFECGLSEDIKITSLNETEGETDEP